jgi:hypothetical protein
MNESAKKVRINRQWVASVFFTKKKLHPKGLRTSPAMSPKRRPETPKKKSRLDVDRTVQRPFIPDPKTSEEGKKPAPLDLLSFPLRSPPRPIATSGAGLRRRRGVQHGRHVVVLLGRLPRHLLEREPHAARRRHGLLLREQRRLVLVLLSRWRLVRCRSRHWDGGRGGGERGNALGLHTRRSIHLQLPPALSLRTLPQCFIVAQLSSGSELGWTGSTTELPAFDQTKLS